MANWNDVRKTQAYLDASPEERARVHLDFFQTVVAPKAKADGMDVDEVYRDYFENTEINPYYNHDFEWGMSLPEYADTAVDQMVDAGKGFNAWLNKVSGGRYSEKDLEQGRRWYNSESGEVEREVAAIAAAMVAPELIPEIAGAGLAARGATMLGKNLASSAAYQLVDEGAINPTQLAIDTGLGMGLESAIHGVSHVIRNPKVDALANVVAPVYKDMDAIERTEHAIAAAEDHVHSVSQITTLSEILERAQKINPEYTAADALKAWAEAAPEMHIAPIEEKISMRGQIFDRTRQTPLQQVVSVITGSRVEPTATVEEMMWLMSDYTVEDLKDIHSIAKKRANRKLTEKLAEQRKANKYTGKFLDLADTQRIIQEQSEGKLWNRIFSSDVASYGTDTLDEFGISQTTRIASKLAGWFENLSIVNKAARKDQANRIAEKFGKAVKSNLKEDIASKTEKYLEAVEDFNLYQRENTIENVAEGTVKRKRANAHRRGLESLENLGEQINLARKGQQINVDKFSDAMYNAQMRKFVENEGNEALTKAKDLKDTARQIKLIGGTASSGSPWSEGLGMSGVGLIFADEVVDQLGNGIVGAGLSSLATATATGYGIKRAIDGAINARLATASRLLRQSTKIDETTGKLIQRNLKVEIDEQIEAWAKNYMEEHPGVEHIPLDEMHKEVDKVVRSELKKLQAGKDLPEWVKKNANLKAAISTAVAEALND